MRADRDRVGRFVTRWIGLALSLLGIVAIGWLAASGELELYIHPRYTAFTVIMAGVAAVLVIAGFVLLPGRGDDEHDEHDEHDHDEHDEFPERHDVAHDPGDPTTAPHARRAAGILTVLRLLVVIAAAIGLLVVPPATLTAATAQNRELSTTGGGIDSDAPTLVGGDTSAFTVKDWSNLLRQGGADAVVGETVRVTGFVIDGEGSDDVLYVARLSITCCAVDAQPVGIPVYSPDWHDRLEPGEWVEVSGAFRDNPDVESTQPVVVVAEELAPIDEPDQPYVF